MPMHFIAPFFIIFGIVGAIVGLLWLVGVGSEEDGGPDQTMFFLFGMLYIGLRVIKALSRDPMSVLPAFGILLGSGTLLWLGIVMVR
jgi:hypothetical protein